MSTLLDVSGLTAHFPIRGTRGSKGSVVRAVENVSFRLDAGEVLGLVGESGCGKTTVARALVGLVRPVAGRVMIDGRPLWELPTRDQRHHRSVIQMIFQDPFESLNPRKTVRQTLIQPLRLHQIVPRADIESEVARLLDVVGLTPASAYLDRYPHEFSGGQRQRIGIARAIAVRPRILVADEAVSALDLSVRAQVLALLVDLKHRLGLSYVFISHDLGVVRAICDRLAVMYLGQIVEQGTAEALFRLARHPYTRALLDASPHPDPVAARARSWTPLEGDVPSPVSPPPGCRFHPRCPVRRPVCGVDDPVKATFEDERWATCHFASEAEEWVSQRGLPRPPQAGKVRRDSNEEEL